MSESNNYIPDEFSIAESIQHSVESATQKGRELFENTLDALRSTKETVAEIYQTVKDHAAEIATAFAGGIVLSACGGQNEVLQSPSEAVLPPGVSIAEVTPQVPDYIYESIEPILTTPDPVGAEGGISLNGVPTEAPVLSIVDGGTPEAPSPVLRVNFPEATTPDATELRFVEFAALLSEALGDLEVQQPTGRSCGPASVVNALDILYGSDGRWISEYDAPLISSIVAEGTTIDAVNSLTESTLGNSLREGYYSISEVASMLDGLGLEAFTLEGRSQEQMLDALNVMASFNNDGRIEVMGIALINSDLTGDEEDHFVVFIPQSVNGALAITLVDSYGPSQVATHDYALNNYIPEAPIANSKGSIIGQSLLLNDERALDFLSDANINTVIAVPIPYIDELIAGMPESMTAMADLALNP